MLFRQFVLYLRVNKNQFLKPHSDGNTDFGWMLLIGKSLSLVKLKWNSQLPVDCCLSLCSKTLIVHKSNAQTIVVRATQFQIQLQPLIKTEGWIQVELFSSTALSYTIRCGMLTFSLCVAHTQVTVFVRLFCSDACTNWSNNLSFLSLWIVIFHWLAFDAL